MKQAPGTFEIIALLTLSVAAISIGVHALASTTVSTPSFHGDSIQVRGINTIYIGIGWVLIGLGFMSRILGTYFAVANQQYVTLSLIVAGGLSWLLVFV